MRAGSVHGRGTKVDKRLTTKRPLWFPKSVLMNSSICIQSEFPMKKGSESPVYCVTMSHFLMCDVQSQEPNVSPLVTSSTESRKIGKYLQHCLSGCVEPVEVAALVVGFETRKFNLMTLFMPAIAITISRLWKTLQL